MPTYPLNVNSREYTLEVRKRTPLLWVLRDTLGMTGASRFTGRSFTITRAGQQANPAKTLIISLWQGGSRKPDTAGRRYQASTVCQSNIVLELARTHPG